MNLTLGRRTTLKPIFLPHPCEGSTVRFADVAAHRVRQIDLIGALKQMFNLCFYSDALTGTLYIEPRDDFYRDDTVIDWSDRIDRSPAGHRSKSSERTLSKLFTFRYQEGDGTVARWDERNKQILGRWSTPILNRFASEGERVYANPLFTPTLNRTGAYPDAPDASLAQVGDRDRTGVPADTENLNFPPKIVRFLGVRTLPDTQRWGWPGYGNEYPEIAFHDPSGDEPVHPLLRRQGRRDRTARRIRPKHRAVQQRATHHGLFAPQPGGHRAADLPERASARLPRPVQAGDRRRDGHVPAGGDQPTTTRRPDRPGASFSKKHSGPSAHPSDKIFRSETGRNPPLA